MERPEPVLLPDGAVLIPVPDEGEGGYRMSRVPVGHPEHARWVQEAQRQQRPVGVGRIAAGVGFGIVGLVAILVLVPVVVVGGLYLILQSGDAVGPVPVLVVLVLLAFAVIGVVVARRASR